VSFLCFLFVKNPRGFCFLEQKERKTHFELTRILHKSTETGLVRGDFSLEKEKFMPMFPGKGRHERTRIRGAFGKKNGRNPEK
jgi:hypothetical protein